jgi:hypothetical protein
MKERATVVATTTLVALFDPSLTDAMKLSITGGTGRTYFI